MSAGRYAIRQALADELAGLPELERAAAQRFRDTAYAWIADDSPHDEAACRAWWARGRVLVAVDEAGAVAGFAAVEVLDGQGYLAEPGVLPAHGRQGLGRRLVAAAQQWAAGQGCTELRLSTFADVPWNAPFYARLGFVPLAPEAVGPALLAERHAEAEGGLDLARRVLMTITL